MQAEDDQQVDALPDSMRRALEDAVADRIVARGAMVLCGFPASGKSTAAQHLATVTGAVVLDKDSLAPLLEQSVMARLTGDPFDRDSEIYRSVVAPGIYDSLIGTGLVVAERHPTILDAPFLSPIREAAAGVMLGQHLRARSGASNDLPVVTVWLDSSPEVIRGRMVARGAQRDHPKLTDWQAYRRDVLVGGVRELAHTVCDVVIGS
ncbi:ATP-binding protein [Nocardia sp. NBC_01730]|uniref:AAA family ATPase n=1 Tax=Nocardia sp. NBC_01730 TaxID=2975998 RepID=UPI002E105124|nr:ATP-binding protein [Nocardia sp. NBC_01730]